MITDSGLGEWFQGISSLLGQLVGVLSILLLIVGFVMLMRNMKKTSTLRIRSHLISIVFSMLMLIINILFLKSAVNLWLVTLAFFLGLAFGFLWGLTTRLTLRGRQVLGRRSILFVIFWLVSLVITYILSLIASRQVVALGLGGMFFSAGTTIGTNLNLILRIVLKRANV